MKFKVTNDTYDGGKIYLMYLIINLMSFLPFIEFSEFIIMENKRGILLNSRNLISQWEL